MLVAKDGRFDDLVIRGARVLDPCEGIDATLDVRTDAGIVTEIATRVDANGHRVVDGAGLVLAPRRPQMHVRVDEGGREDQARAVDDAVAVRVHLGRDLGDEAGVGADVEGRVDPLGRVDDARAADDEIVEAAVLREEHHATSTAAAAWTPTGPPVSRS